MRGQLRGIVAALLFSGAFAAPAMAYGPAGSDPSSNFNVGSLPLACQTDPTGSACVDAAVSYLDQARASLGQPAYVLPADFDSLSPVQQVFILTNSDRLLYGLAPIPGLTAALSQDAAAGVRADNDPQPSDSNAWGWTSNWAGGYENIVLAYEAWMYDDGPGSDNLDCTSTDSTGCWGHRQDILWQFGTGGTLAMGAAAGTDPSNTPGYAMLLEQSGPGSHPSYTYTWAQAVADGAGGSSGSDGEGGSTGSTGGSGSGTSSGSSGGAGSTGSGSASAAGIRITKLQALGHRLRVSIATPAGTLLRCSLDRRVGTVWRLVRSKSCTQHAAFSHLPAGRYRLRVTSRKGRLTRRFVIT
jgi:uncharacterized membrane protein YgcG